MVRVSAHYKIAGRASRVADRVRDKDVLPLEDKPGPIRKPGRKELVLDKQVPGFELLRGIGWI